MFFDLDLRKSGERQYTASTRFKHATVPNPYQAVRSAIARNAPHRPIVPRPVAATFRFFIDLGPQVIEITDRKAGDKVRVLRIAHENAFDGLTDTARHLIAQAVSDRAFPEHALKPKEENGVTVLDQDNHPRMP